MTYTKSADCSICGNPVSLCMCRDNPAVRLGVRMGNVWQEESAKTIAKMPMDDRVLFFSGFMATCLGHMKAAIGPDASRAVIDGIKLLADG